MNTPNEQLAEQMHIWYLEASKELHPESYNPNAQKSYADLTEEQKFLDRYIARQVLSHFAADRAELVRKLEKEKLRKGLDIGGFQWPELECDFNKGLNLAIALLRHTGEDNQNER